MKPCIYVQTNNLRTVKNVVRAIKEEDKVDVFEHDENSKEQVLRVYPAFLEVIPDFAKQWSEYDPVVLHGGSLFLKSASETNMFGDYVFPVKKETTPEKLRALLGARYAFDRGAERTCRELRSEWYSLREPLYISPLFDTSMSPGIYTRSEFRDACTLHSLKNENNFLVDSTYRTPESEFMIWVVKGKIVFAMQSRLNGVFNIDIRAATSGVKFFFADKILPALPIDTYVAYLGFDSQHHYRLRDITCINNTLWCDEEAGKIIVRGWLEALKGK